MTTKQEHFAQLVAVLATEGPRLPHHTLAEDAIALERLSRKMSRLAVRRCNGEGHYDFAKRRRVWDDTDDAKHDAAKTRIRLSAEKIAARYGAKVELGGDPRGCVLRLHLTTGRTNGFGEGWCV